MKGICIVLLVLAIGLCFVSAGEKTSMIVFQKNPHIDKSFDIDRVYTSLGGFAGEFTEEQIKEMKKDSFVFPDKKVFALLDYSSVQIGATTSHGLLANGVNLTGSGQSICVIDTGVNYSLAEFGGCYGNNDPDSDCVVIGGYDFVNSDSDPMDDFGHGTHVTSVVTSSNSVYGGISPSTKIIAIKALDNTGWGDISNVIAGIEWCVTNATLFNISVISMSLGDCSEHTTYCNSDPEAVAIDEAVSNGIAVVVAAGNCDTRYCSGISCTSGISAPACVQSAIAVGAVNDSDSIWYQRGPLFELLAPGLSIVSEGINGVFGGFSGTSASTPHVASSIAILQQLSKIQSGGLMSVSQIKNVLNNTGKRIDDTAGSGYNFSRINLYGAILSIDGLSPTINLISPLDDDVGLISNKSFECNFSDWQLKNASLEIWNGTGLYYLSETVNVSGMSNSSSFNATDLPSGNYEWNCLVCDEKNNCGLSLENFSFTIGGVYTYLNFPGNNTYTNLNQTNFSCGAISESSHELRNITFYLWNGSLIYNETKEFSGTSNQTNFTYNFSDDGNYTWGCTALNNDSNFSSSVNYTLVFDDTAPVISNLVEDASDSSVTITWETNEASNSSSTLGGNSSEMVLAHSISVGSLSSSTEYNYQVTSCDRAGNCVSELSSFTTDTVPVPVTTSSGDAAESRAVGGALSPVLPEQISYDGENKEIRLNQKIIFDLGDGVNHTLVVLRVENKSALLFFELDNIVLNVSEGGEFKINFTADYYDLLIRINSIYGNKVNMSLYKIHEPINKDDDGKVFAMNETSDDIPTYSKSRPIVIVILLASFLVIVFILVGAIILICRLIRKHNAKIKTKAVGT